MIDYELSYPALDGGAAIQAHIHFGGRDHNGGQGIEPGSFAELVAAMRVGNSYANVHTTRWPGGEIRGQINNDNQREFVR